MRSQMEKIIHLGWVSNKNQRRFGFQKDPKDFILGRVHTKTGLVTQTGFILLCPNGRCKSVLESCWFIPESALSNGRIGLNEIGFIQNSFNQVSMKPIYMRSSLVSRPHSDRVLSHVDTALYIVVFTTYVLLLQYFKMLHVPMFFLA